MIKEVIPEFKYRCGNCGRGMMTPRNPIINVAHPEIEKVFCTKKCREEYREKQRRKTND